MAKNIVVFSDGTGQDGGARPEQRISNIYKMYRISRDHADTTIDPSQQVVFYDAGLGTDVGTTALTAPVRFDGVETARVMDRLYAAARLYVNFFQPSFKLKEKRREGAKVIKRYHPPSTPYERALAHPKVTAAVKKRLRDQYRSLDPVGLLAEIRATQDELGNRVDHRAGQARGLQAAHTSTAPATAATFAKKLGKRVTAGEPRATHRRTRRSYKTRVRMPSKLDPHIAAIEGWLAEQPQLTALAIIGRLSEKSPRKVRDETAFDRAAPAQGA